MTRVFATVGAVAVSLAGCGDPTLDVAFSVPDGFVSEVVSAQVRLLRPPSGADFGCEALSFGEVSEATIRLSLERQLGVDGDERAPFVDIDRVAAKVFLAEGLDASGRVLVAGCAEVGEVIDGTERVIVGEPIPELALTSPATVAVDLGRQARLAVQAQLEDRLGRALGGVQVRWREVSGGAPPVVGAGESDPAGQVRLDASTPARPGPFVVEVRARWAEGAPKTISGFVRPRPETLSLSGEAIAYRAGWVGPGGAPGIVALLADGPGEFRVTRVYRGPEGALVEIPSETIRGQQPVLGLIEGVADQVDRPIVVTRSDWWEVDPAGVAVERQAYRPPGFPVVSPARVLAFNPCEGAESRMLVVYRDRLAVEHDAEGRRLSAFQDPLDVVTAGCVDNEIGPSARLMVVAQPDLQPQLVVEVNPTLFWIRSWIALPSGINITRSADGRPGLLLGSQLNLNDVVVSRAAIRADTSRFELVIRATDRPPEVPLFTDGADLDGDGLVDLVSLVRRFQPDGAGPFALWAVLGVQPEGRRLSGDADLIGGPGPTAFIEPRLLVADLDGDGRDDVVVAERTGGVGRASQVVVYPMGPSP